MDSVSTSGPIVGDGTPANPIGIQSGTNAGDMLIWDGTQWIIKPSPYDSVCGTAMNNYVQKWTGTKLCNSIIYDDGIKVGIGRLPASSIRLDVQGKLRGYPSLVLVNSNPIEGGQIVLGPGGDTTITGETCNTWSIDVRNYKYRVFYGSALCLNSVVAMAIDTFGRIGIKRAPSNSRFHILGDTAESPLWVQTIDTTGGTPVTRTGIYVSPRGWVGIGTTGFNDTSCESCNLQVLGRMMLRSWDAVYNSGYDGVPWNYELIGTYMGWDRGAIYIGGYNYYFPRVGDTLMSYAKRLRIGGGGTSPAKQVIVDFQTGNMGLGTAAPTEKLHVVGNIRSSSAFTVNVNGCGSNVCSYTVNFPVPFSTPPVVNITAGPNANSTWAPLVAMVQNVTTTSVTFVLDSTDPGQAISGTNTVHIIAIAP